MKKAFFLFFLLPIGLDAQRDTIFGLDGSRTFQKRMPSGDLISPADTSPLPAHFRQISEKLIGQPMPAFEYRDALGQPVFSGDFNRKIRVFYFGDIWHDPCLVHFEALKIFQGRNEKTGLRTLVFTSNEASQFGERVDARNSPFPFLVNAGATIFSPETGGEGGYPRLLFIDRNGLIQRVEMMIPNGTAEEIAARWQVVFDHLFNKNDSK